jgi:hypothetical protein
LKTELCSKLDETMKKGLLFIFTLVLSTAFNAQSTDCYKKFEEAFTKRGSYTVGDEMHRNVIISYFDKTGAAVECVAGKARVENGLIVSIFVQYGDGTYELLDKKFFNEKKTMPSISNGISEMIYTTDGEKFKIIFIDKLKPKQKEKKQVVIPDDL